MGPCGSMKIGCGCVEKTIHGGLYLYVWHFEARGYLVRKVERYMGPAKSLDARRRALQELEAYAARATADLERRRAAWRRQLGGP